MNRALGLPGRRYESGEGNRYRYTAHCLKNFERSHDGCNQVITIDVHVKLVLCRRTIYAYTLRGKDTLSQEKEICSASQTFARAE